MRTTAYWYEVRGQMFIPAQGITLTFLFAQAGEKTADAYIRSKGLANSLSVRIWPALFACVSDHLTPAQSAVRQTVNREELRKK